MAVLLRLMVPRLRERSRRVSELRSTLTGRVVDGYTNILTVKLFARAEDEDEFRPRGDRGPHRRLPGADAGDHDDDRSAFRSSTRCCWW